jgi:hypothetical protein
MKESGRSFDCKFGTKNLGSGTLRSSSNPFNLIVSIPYLFESRVLTECSFITLQSERVYERIGNQIYLLKRSTNRSRCGSLLVSNGGSIRDACELACLLEALIAFACSVDTLWLTPRGSQWESVGIPWYLSLISDPWSSLSESLSELQTSLPSSRTCFRPPIETCLVECIQRGTFTAVSGSRESSWSERKNIGGDANLEHAFRIFTWAKSCPSSVSRFFSGSFRSAYGPN